MRVLIDGVVVCLTLHRLSSCSQETRKKQQLKVKIQMAKFLQDTIEDMAVTGKNKKKREAVEEFARFFEKVGAGLYFAQLAP